MTEDLDYIKLTSTFRLQDDELLIIEVKDAGNESILQVLVESEVGGSQDEVPEEFLRSREGRSGTRTPKPGGCDQTLIQPLILFGLLLLQEGQKA